MQVGEGGGGGWAASRLSKGRVWSRSNSVLGIPAVSYSVEREGRLQRNDTALPAWGFPNSQLETRKCYAA